MRFPQTAMIVVLAFAIIALLPRASVCAQTSKPTTMRMLGNRARVLLIFSESASDPKAIEQLAILAADTPAATERDLTAVLVAHQGPATGVSLTEAEAALERRRFQIKPDEFAVLLIGKDGQEKLRSTKPVSMERLREVIDAMPMRQEEMRKKKAAS